ncbi:hypothetical protein [Micromonospora sp. NPDC048839]|uniref:hypothetical protein n=1 Tax=Micromonospora sp. NPDC048839 TaxID=3155641 RepID=UPI0033CA54C0
MSSPHYELDAQPKAGAPFATASRDRGASVRELRRELAAAVIGASGDGSRRPGGHEGHR